MYVNRDYVTTAAAYDWNDPQWIVIHYTAGAWGVSAENNAIYYKREGANLQVGTHYFLGDDGIFASTPEYMGAWTNGNWDAGHHSITIEVACGTDEPSFTDKEISLLRELVTDIMGRYGIPADHVIRHYDVADVFGGSTADPHKQCPRQYIDQAAWSKLRSQITEEDDMQLSDKLNDNKLPDGTNNNVANVLNRTRIQVDSLVTSVAALSAKVDKISAGGATVDYDKLANKVADVIYNRMKA